MKVTEANIAVTEMKALWHEAEQLKDRMFLADTCDKWVTRELEFQLKISEFISASAKANRLARQYREEHN